MYVVFHKKTFTTIKKIPNETALKHYAHRLRYNSSDLSQIAVCIENDESLKTWPITDWIKD